LRTRAANVRLQSYICQARPDGRDQERIAHHHVTECNKSPRPTCARAISLFPSLHRPALRHGVRFHGSTARSALKIDVAPAAQEVMPIGVHAPGAPTPGTTPCVAFSWDGVLFQAPSTCGPRGTPSLRTRLHDLSGLRGIHRSGRCVVLETETSCAVRSSIIVAALKVSISALRISAASTVGQLSRVRIWGVCGSTPAGTRLAFPPLSRRCLAHRSGVPPGTASPYRVPPLRQVGGGKRAFLLQEGGAQGPD
jgi:hypothetical protein